MVGGDGLSLLTKARNLRDDRTSPADTGGLHCEPRPDGQTGEDEQRCRNGNDWTPPQYGAARLRRPTRPTNMLEVFKKLRSRRMTRLALFFQAAKHDSLQLEAAGHSFKERGGGGVSPQVAMRVETLESPANGR